jgi:hypothetical protein
MVHDILIIPALAETVDFLILSDAIGSTGMPNNGRVMIPWQVGQRVFLPACLFETEMPLLQCLQANFIFSELPGTIRAVPHLQVPSLPT